MSSNDVFAPKIGSELRMSGFWKRSARTIAVLVFVYFFGFSPAFAWADDLHNAAKKNDTKKIIALLDKGKKIDEVDKKTGLLPLHFAVQAGHLQAIELL